MHKLFKPYLYGGVALAVLLILLTVINFQAELTSEAFLIIIYGVILEAIMFVYAQNKAVSLQGAITIFSVIIFNPATSLIVCIIAFIFENITMRVLKRQGIFDLNFKIIFNFSMRTICVITTKAIITQLSGLHIIPIIILASIIYNTINIGMLLVMIYFMTGNKQLNKDLIKQNMIYNYISVMVITMLYYSYTAYSIEGIVAIFLFLIPLQPTLLGQTVQKEVKASVFIDALTKAYNRASLNKILNDYLHDKTPFTIIFLDFNRFKIINDTYGHDAGDNVLIQFVQEVRSKLRKDDKIYRFGGDEFCLVVDDENSVEHILEKMNSIKETLVLEYGELKIPYSFSIGLYKYNGKNCNNVDEVIRNASHKMEEDKRKMHKEDGLQGTYVDSRLVNS